MRQKWVLVAALVLLSSVALGVGDGRVHIYFVDVGQGDSSLVIGPAGTSCLIDGGASNSYSTNIDAAMDDAIANGWTDAGLDYVLVTHLHSDHLYALDEVHAQYPGALIASYDRTGTYSSAAFDSYNAYFGTAGLNKRQGARTFSLDSATMTYLGRGGSNSSSDENNNGVIFRLDFANFQCWFGGDLGYEYEAPKGQDCGPVEFYQANHHGSRTSSQADFLSSIQPYAHVFSYGTNNSYGHPHQEAVDRLNAIGSARYDTPQDHYQGGPYVYLETDGATGFSVNGHAYPLHEGSQPTPTPSPSATPSPSPTATPSPSPSPTPTLTPSPTPTAAPGVMTFTSVAADDGWALEKSENSSTGGSVNATGTVITVGDDPNDKGYRGVLSFDTSGLPDGAVVIRATLKLTRTSVTGTSPFQTHGGCVVDIKSPYLGSNASLAKSDWEAAVSAAAVATMPEPNSNGQQVEADLSAAGLPYVNKTGKTQFKVRFTVEDNDDLSADYINFASGNHGTADYRPVLEVEY